MTAELLAPAGPSVDQALRAGPVLTVHLDAVARNTRLFARRATGRLMAVVKADAFGHGAADVARTALANGATSLGVATIEEGLTLRNAGIAAPVLSWLNPVDADFATALRRGLALAAPSAQHLDAVAEAAWWTGRIAEIHLHADVGMARDGAPPDSWKDLCRLAATGQRHGLFRVVGVMGHLACADQPGHSSNRLARARFDRCVATAAHWGLRPTARHLAATAAALTDPSLHYDLVRVGAGLFGIDPSRSTPLAAALELTAPVVSVRDVPAGTPVGYGHRHVTSRATRLALLPVGYADGIPRHAAGQVLLQGRRQHLVGAVSMDQCVVDAGDLPVRPGDVATVFGPGDRGEPTVTEWAGWSGTIEHEIVTGIGPRVRRRIR